MNIIVTDNAKSMGFYCPTKTTEIMKDVDNIKRVVKDIRYLIATDCCDETIEARIENYIAEGKGQSLPIDNVSECIYDGCKSKRHWHFIYCKHHAKLNKLI